MKSKSFVILVMNGWDRLPEVVDGVSVREFKGRLNNVWLAIFRENSV